MSQASAEAKGAQAFAAYISVAYKGAGGLGHCLEQLDALRSAGIDPTADVYDALCAACACAPNAQGENFEIVLGLLEQSQYHGLGPTRAGIQHALQLGAYTDYVRSFC